MRDDIQTPLERAVFWTEYVIRHRGAPHLRSPARDADWVRFFHLDIWLFLLCCVAMQSWLIWKGTLVLLRKVYRR